MKLPAGTRPGRIGLAVPSPYEVSSFYEDVVGLSLFEYTETTGQLGVGDRTLVELTDGSDRAPRNSSEAGLYHVAFEFPSRTALADALLRIDSFYELDGATDHGVMQSLYLTDPAGNGVELYVTAPREEWPENDEGEPIIRGLERVSRPARRVYVGADEIPNVWNGLGIAILSTSHGVLTDRQARRANIGGEVMCKVY